MLAEFCTYCEEILGGSHEFIKHPMGYNILVIANGEDKFKINLSDKFRFGKFNLSHRNSGRFLNGNYGYHVQTTTRELSYAIFVAYSHNFHKENHIFWSQKDYKRFMQDWRRYCNEQIVQENSGSIVG